MFKVEKKKSIDLPFFQVVAQSSSAQALAPLATFAAGATHGDGNSSA
jgi:hypothetical protein